MFSAWRIAHNCALLLWLSLLLTFINRMWFTLPTVNCCCSNLISWTAPGAASDCGASWTVDVIPGYEKSGMIQVTVPLPGSVIQGWVTKQGVQNYGVLLR